MEIENSIIITETYTQHRRSYVILHTFNETFENNTTIHSTNIQMENTTNNIHSLLLKMTVSEFVQQSKSDIWIEYLSFSFFVNFVLNFNFYRF